MFRQIMGALEKTLQSSFIGLIKAYQYILSPWVGRGCRFYPTCSCYAIEAIQTHGSLKGVLLTLWRLMRCHPLCAGGLDPVPSRFLGKSASSKSSSPES